MHGSGARTPAHSEDDSRMVVHPYCPRCGARVYRVRRLLRDRIVSIVYPVFRFRCDGIDCDWEGRIPQRHLLR